MKRTAIDPWSWSLPLGFHQAEILEGPKRTLVCAGQTAVDAEGRPQHEGDMRGQIALALDNLETVLGAAGMSVADVVRLVVYTTDVDAALAQFDLLGRRFGPAGVSPPMTLVGVTRLAQPSLLIEFEATAAD